jgi:transposase InsO family protein
MDKQEHALAQLRHVLANAPVTAYFDPEKTSEISVDASPVGLGAILAQIDPTTKVKRIIAYASRSLTTTEQRYSQTEREALAVVWACEHFHLYIYGKPVNVYTDHKPLVAIYGNANSKPPARIERWALRLQPYQTTVHYRKGEENPADYMSRHPSSHTEPCSRQEKVAEEYINYIATTSTPTALTLSMIAEATGRDPTLRAVIDAVQSGKWHELAKHPKVDTDTFHTYERLKDELTVGTTTQVVIRGTKLVIPNKLQRRVVDLAHEGHQGITKTKSLLREKVWFPGINKMVEERVKSCLACQVATPEAAREPLQMSTLPDQAWDEISVDFAELSTGDYLLVVSDDYSRYPIVEVIRSVAAQTVIPKLQHIFSQFGIPGILKSDNGPPFNSEAFATFAANLGFTHRKITPYWPRANGEVERFMRTVKKIVKIALTQQKPWREELTNFLRNFRATPHSSTGKAPATAFFNRQLRTKLPDVHTNARDPAGIQETDQKAKRKMKKYADSKAYVKPSRVRPGDTVVLKRDPSHRKSETPYEPKPYKVISCKGSMVTATRGEKTVTRNSSFFKLVRQKDEPTEGDSTDGEHDNLEDTDGEPDNIAQAEEQQQEPHRYPQRVRAPPRHLADYA